jgi:hypothetical protein
MASRGIVYIAYGDNARAKTHQAIQSLVKWQQHYAVCVISEGVTVDGCDFEMFSRRGLPYWQAARAAKVILYDLSPYDHTLYVDADTRIQGNVSIGFKLLDDGYDLVIVPSANQGSDVLWNVAADERQRTFEEVGFRPLQLQAGVMWFRKSDATRQFFVAWAKEWARFEGQDQAAFTRALVQSPVKVWLLGRPFNGGAVIQHWFGACR